MTWAITDGTGYLLCFDVPFGTRRPATRPEAEKFTTASHYLGITDYFDRHMREHAEGRAAKLTRHVAEAGIGWTVTRLWEGADRNTESALKAPGPSHWCPRCQAERVMKRDPVYQAIMAQARGQFLLSIEDARSRRAQAGSKGAGTRIWKKATQQAQQDLRAVRRQAAADWISRHPGYHMRSATVAGLLEDKPVVMAVSARRPDAGTRKRAAVAAQPGADAGQAAAREPAVSEYDPEDPWSWPPPVGPDIEAA
jgi:hypothetical protein